MPLLAGPVLAVRQMECTPARNVFLDYTFKFLPLLLCRMSGPLAGLYACVHPAHHCAFEVIRSRLLMVVTPLQYPTIVAILSLLPSTSHTLKSSNCAK